MKNAPYRGLGLVVVLSLTCSGQLVADDLPPGIEDTQNPADVSLSPSESLARIQVPDGFHVTLFAGEPAVRRPIAFDFDDRGRLWVIENYSHPNWDEGESPDRVVILEDTNYDGRFDRKKVFWDKGRYLTGIAYGHGGIWIANTPELSFIPDRDGDDVPDTEPVVKLDGFQIAKNNAVNNLHWGPDGWLYGAIGSSTASSVGKPGANPDDRTPITRGMWRYHPARETFEVIALGMVNPWGADFNEFGDLITTNTVIAHLWHIVPGMYCQRRPSEIDNPYAYVRIQSIADHLHWGGGQWQSSRVTDEHHSVAGGGHAHCGGMIYLGDNWPDQYRGKWFTGNLHGNRINSDRLVPKGSSYVGLHESDFLFANDPWFRSMSQKYGPDGGVFVSDWHDYGECHDTDGSHRSSGRIYKVVYGRPGKRQVNLLRASDAELVQLHTHRNEWFVRRARRILVERANAGQSMSDVQASLQRLFQLQEETPARLRCLWTLYSIGGFPEGALVGLLADSNSHVRRWAIKLLCDHGRPSEEATTAIAALADDDAAIVRLAVASAAVKLPAEDRWTIAERLSRHQQDAADHYLPAMTWYMLEPLVATDLPRALRLARRSRIPQLSAWIARRAMDQSSPPTELLIQDLLEESDVSVRTNILRGILDALDAHGRTDAPTSWRILHAQLRRSPNIELRSLGSRLAVLFGDQEAIASLQSRVDDSTLAADDRRATLRELIRLDAVTLDLLHDLVRERGALRGDAIRALALRASTETGDVLLREYSELDASQRSDAISVLVSRKDTAARLLDAIGSGVIEQTEVSAYALQTLRAFRDEKIKTAVRKVWRDDAARTQLADQIVEYKRLLSPQYLRGGNASAGRAIFESTCAKCHRLFGEGHELAPDLTGSGRKQVDYLLGNLVDPSGLIDPAYRLTTVVTGEGRQLNGFIMRLTEQAVMLKTQEGEVRIPLEEVELMNTSTKSMMPDGLLQTYTDEQVRDLFGYLMSDDQVPLPHGFSSRKP
jgi:putative membrane-bound dehydrogenase-like protein